MGKHWRPELYPDHHLQHMLAWCEQQADRTTSADRRRRYTNRRARIVRELEKRGIACVSKR